MTYVNTTVPIAYATDADWRVQALSVHDALIAAGLVQTSDTGQVDIATAVKPAALAYAGYRIYRFNDTLQATAPVFVKIEYGSGTGAVYLGLATTVGTGTNGSGTLTGRVSGRVVQGAAATITPGPLSDLKVATGLDKSYLVLFWYIDQTSAKMGGSLVIDRTRNADGTPNGDGLYLVIASGVSSPNCYLLVNTGILPGTTSPGGVLCLTPSSTTYLTGVQGLEVSLLPHFCFTPKLHAPQKAILSYYVNDIPYNTSLMVTHYGAAPYVAMGTRCTSWGSQPSGVNASLTLAFRAE